MTLAIRVHRLRYHPPGKPDLEILNIPEFSLAEGDSCVLHGPSGSGKSTFFHLLAGLLPAPTGELEVSGTPLHTLGEPERDRFRARRIGLVFQSFNLLQGLSALDNVLLGATISGSNLPRAAVEELLSGAGLEGRFNHFPSELSVGERQRVAVLRAVASSPPIILADEPTASLDPKRAGEIMDLLEREAAKRKSTLLVISHDPETKKRFPRAVAFDELNLALRPQDSGVV